LKVFVRKVEPGRTDCVGIGMANTWRGKEKE
jgi:hypothetical protein